MNLGNEADGLVTLRWSGLEWSYADGSYTVDGHTVTQVGPGAWALFEPRRKTASFEFETLDKAVRFLVLRRRL